jgi:hypothetical protein
LISVEGAAPDKAAIDFARHFYTQLWRNDAPIERAFHVAETLCAESGLLLQISRRGLARADSDFIVEAQIEYDYKIIVDLTPVRAYLEALTDRIREDVLRAICRSIRAHRRLFTLPMERVAIPFGRHIGLFSWQNDIDPVRCEQIFRIASDVPSRVFDAVAFLMYRYSRIASARYRVATETIYAGQEPVLRTALSEFNEDIRLVLEGNYGEALSSIAADDLKIAQGIIKANLLEADSALSRHDHVQTIVYLETALTTLHNLLIQVLDAVKA